MPETPEQLHARASAGLRLPPLADAARLFSKDKRVEKITVALGQDSYTVSMSGDRAVASRSKTVGGSRSATRSSRSTNG